MSYGRPCGRGVPSRSSVTVLSVRALSIRGDVDCRWKSRAATLTNLASTIHRSPEEGDPLGATPLDFVIELFPMSNPLPPVTRM